MRRLLTLTLALCGALSAQSLTSTTTTGAVTPDSPSLQLASTTGAAVGYELYVDREAMIITAVGSGAVTVKRGQEGTAATSHLSGSTVYVGPSRFFSPNDLNGSGCTSKAAVGETLLSVRSGSRWTCQASGVWLAAAVSTLPFTDDGSTVTFATSRNLSIGATPPIGAATGSVALNGSLYGNGAGLTSTPYLSPNLWPSPDYLGSASWSASVGGGSSAYAAPDGTNGALLLKFAAQFEAFKPAAAAAVQVGRPYVISFWAIGVTGTNAYSVWDQTNNALVASFTPASTWTFYSFIWYPASAGATLNLMQDRNASGFGWAAIWQPYLGRYTFGSGNKTLSQSPLAFWGDSLTYGVGDGGQSYPTQLQGMLEGLYSGYNGGVGGYTSTQIATAMLAATSHYGDTAVIWAGRNNYSSPSTVLADVASMVAALTSSPKKFVVLSVLNSNVPTEYVGTANYTTISALNASLAAAYPNNYLDVWSPLVAAYNPSSAQETLDHTNGVVPTSLRAMDISGTLTSTIDGSVTSFQLSGSTAPYAYLTITIGTEIMQVTSVSGASSPWTVNVVRGYASSTAAGHTSGVAWQGRDTVHLSTAGYFLVARKVRQWICEHYGCTPPALQ